MKKMNVIMACAGGWVGSACWGSACPARVQDRPEGQDRIKEKDEKAGEPVKKTVYDFTVKDIDGHDVPLATFKGDVLLIINVASRCGYTESNYSRMQPLHEKYKKEGFHVLAFPCNDFGAQEPGSADEIKEFCRVKYHGDYDLFGKIKVKGDEAEPLYKYLTQHPDKAIRGEVKWNFQKYLVGRDGAVLAKFSPAVKPDDPELIKVLEQALRAPRPNDEKETSEKGESQESPSPQTPQDDKG